MLRILLAFVVGVMMLVAAPQESKAATSRNFAEIYTDCGLGGMLFQHRKWGGLAAVSNIIWDLGTTAISSQLTTPDSCMGGKQEKLAAFINGSYEAIESDLSKGNGEHLDKLLALAGKPLNDVQFVEALRQDLASRVAASSYADQTRYQKAEALYNSVYKQTDALSS
jgi:hypothetical protein